MIGGVNGGKLWNEYIKYGMLQQRDGCNVHCVLFVCLFVSDLDVEFGLIHKIKTKDLIKYKHKMKNQQSKRVLDEFLHSQQNDHDGVVPKFTKLPSAMLQEMDLVDFKNKKIRKRSTMTQFKSIQKEYVDLPELSGWMEKKSASGLKLSIELTLFKLSF